MAFKVHGVRHSHCPTGSFIPFLCAKRVRSIDLGAQGKNFASHNFTVRRPSLTCRAEQQEGDSPDLIERMVGALFGKKALEAAEPFGMKRMSDEAYNEQSVATTTEFADSVLGDSPEVALFRPLLAKTRLETKPLRCAWLHVAHRQVHSCCVYLSPGHSDRLLFW